MDQKEAIDKVRAYSELLKKHFQFDSVYLFGSYASGNYRKDSDIDVAVIVDRAEKDFFQINPLLWKIRREIDDRIEPVLIEREFDEAGFLDEIKKTGIEIAT